MKDQEKDQLRKVLKFAILCSEDKIEDAQSLLSELIKQSYHSALKRLHGSIIKIPQLQLNITFFKLKIIDNESTISRLKNQIVDLKNRHVEDKTTKEQLRLFGLLEHNEFSKAKKLAEEASHFTIKELIDEIVEYRYIKGHIASQVTPQFAQIPNFTAQGGNLFKKIKESVSIRKKINDFLVDEIKHYLKEEKIGVMDQIYFTQQFQDMYEKLIIKFREIKNQLSNKQLEMKEKIEKLSKKLSLGLKDAQKFSEYFDNFLTEVQADFKRLEEQPKVPQSFNKSSISEVLSQRHSQNDFNYSPSEDLVKSSRVFKKTDNNIYQSRVSKIKNRPSINKDSSSKSQEYNQLALENQISKLIKIVFQDTEEVNKIMVIPMIQRSQKLAIKLQSIMEEFKRLKKDSELFIPQMLVSKILAEQSNFSQIPLNRQPSSHQQQNEATIRNLEYLLRSCNQEKKKLQDYLKFNRKHENKSYIQQSSIFNKCTETVEDLSQKIKISEQETQKLKAQLQIKSRLISTQQHQNNKIKKQLQEQKQSLQRMQKRYNKLKEDFDDQTQEINKLNTLYQERFMIESQEANCRLTQSVYVKISKEKQELENKNINLSAQNEILKSKVQMKKETHEFGAGSQVIQPGDELFGSMSENGSFMANMPNVSSIMEQSFTPNVEIDIKPYEEKIISLQKTIDVMTNEQMQRQMNYQAALLAQTKEIQRLKEAKIELQYENELLKHKLQSIDIRAITHNETNIKNLHLFPPGFIFEEYEYEERLFLLENLLTEVGPIKATRLLYRSDVHNKTNFHNYIDNHRHIVIVIKTVYGRLIAGYSQQAFNPREIRKGRGIIMSLWAKKAFYVGDRRAITYDDYYLIFGNSELRIRSQQFKLFSNFAIANSHYDNKGEKVGVLLGEDHLREVDIMKYEVYTLDLDQ